MGERYGYVRVSTKDQHPDRQIENIKKHYPDIKDDNLFIEKISGKKGMDERDEYAVLRRIVRSGDELVIDALDRLGRKKTDIKAELEYLKTKGVVIRVLLIPTTLVEIDGQEWAIEMINNLLIEVYTSLAQQEISEKERRQRDGIEVAKANGVYKGRKPIEYDEVKFTDLYKRWRNGAIKAKEFMELMGLKPNTFYRIVKRYEMELTT
jgi:DNA invertase Pin-like site-specific DNA recombinase